MSVNANFNAYMKYPKSAPERWNNLDPTLKEKQKQTSDFQLCKTLVQRRLPTLEERLNNVATTLSRRCFNVALTLVKAISKEANFTYF